MIAYMPFDKSKYPPNWKQIRQQILARAGHRCEFEGCGLPNHCYILRNKSGEHWPEKGWTLEQLKEDGEGYVPERFGHIEKHTKIVLTIAHLDQDTNNNDPGNLAAYCQYHHLNHDKYQHGRNAAATRARKKRQQIEKAGQMALGLDV